MAFGAPEEPVLYPEGEDGDLDSVLTAAQTAALLGDLSPLVADAVRKLASQ